MLTLAPGVLFAHAQFATPPESVTTKVSLADLDLATPEGARAARDRLAKTANRLCRKFSDERKVSNVATLADCTRDTLNEALKRLNRPLVAAAR
jgi:UrcA family protein